MNRLEKRYLWTADILAWGHGRYTKAYLESLTMPELAEVHNKVYIQHLIELETIRA